MSIKGKIEGVFRLLGSILILLSLILSIILSILALNNFFLNFIILLIILPPFFVSILLKLEQDLIVKNSSRIFFSLLFLISILNLVILPFNGTSFIIRFVIVEFLDLLLISCWHFALSLYKRVKLIFLISGISSLTLNVVLLYSLQNLFILSLILMLIFLLGFFLIISTELIMKKKGLLNFI